jgi:hypothetical protein
VVFIAELLLSFVEKQARRTARKGEEKLLAERKTGGAFGKNPCENPETLRNNTRLPFAAADRVL